MSRATNQAESLQKSPRPADPKLATQTRGNAGQNGRPAEKHAQDGAALPREHIALRAWSIWQARGCPPNQAETHWLEAESQLRREAAGGGRQKQL